MSSNAGGTARPRRVLILDDSEDSALLLAQLLTLAGCEVRTLLTARGFFEILAELNPDVLILDIQLGGSPTGLDLTREVCQDGRPGRPFIVIVSGWTRPQDRLEAEEAGCDAFVPKPAEPEVLVELALKGERRRTTAGQPPRGIRERRWQQSDD